MNNPPIPAGAGYSLDAPDRLIVEPEAAKPPVEHWIQLWRWTDGAGLYVPTFSPMASRPCRWSTECYESAIVTIDHRKYGKIDACEKCAGDYLASNSAINVLNDWEGEPDCACPDQPKKRVPYCPAHGKGPERGLDPLRPREQRAQAGATDG